MFVFFFIQNLGVFITLDAALPILYPRLWYKLLGPVSARSLKGILIGNIYSLFLLVGFTRLVPLS
ncbi:hypothetical protein AB4K20DRAFT_1886232 [Rhizopus microsporus]